jgi:ureidoacrylate peracid hydrolase
MIETDTINAVIERGRVITRFGAVEGARTALLVIDLQNGFMLPEHPFGNPRALALVPVVNRLAEAVRDAGGTVAFTRHTYAENGPRAVAPWQAENKVIKALAREFTKGGKAHDLHEALDVRDGDVVMDKYRYSAFTFNSSELHETLQGMGIDTLIVTGCVANCCCETTERDAYQLGYKVIHVADGNAGLTAEEEAATMMGVSSVCADVRPSSEVLELLAAARAKAA